MKRYNYFQPTRKQYTHFQVPPPKKNRRQTALLIHLHGARCLRGFLSGEKETNEKAYRLFSSLNGKLFETHHLKKMEIYSRLNSSLKKEFYGRYYTFLEKGKLLLILQKPQSLLLKSLCNQNEALGLLTTLLHGKRKKASGILPTRKTNFY